MSRRYKGHNIGPGLLHQVVLRVFEELCKQPGGDLWMDNFPPFLSLFSWLFPFYLLPFLFRMNQFFLSLNHFFWGGVGIKKNSLNYISFKLISSGRLQSQGTFTGMEFPTREFHILRFPTRFTLFQSLEATFIVDTPPGPKAGRGQMTAGLQENSSKIMCWTWIHPGNLT